MKNKLFGILLTKKLGQVEIVPMSLSFDEEVVRENCAKIQVMFPDNKYTPCELCPVAMEVQS